MKRYPLLIQLVLYFFLFILLLFGLIGSLYYQTSSGTIRQQTERTTRNSIDQSSQFITSYLKKLKQTTTVLSKEQAVRQFAQDKSANQETVQHLMRTMIETDPDLVSAVLVTKDGRLVATDSKISMQTSSDMMNESWYQEAIKERAMPVLTPARKESLTSEKEKWVVSITQEVVDQTGQNLGVVRLDIGYDSLQAYLDHLQLGKQGFSFIINQKHEFVYHPKKAVYSSSQEMQAMQPYIAVKDGYGKGGENFIYQVPIPDSDWTLIGVASLEGLQMLQSQLLYSFIGLGLLALIMCLIGIGFVLRLWIKPLRDLQTIILRIGAGDAHLRAAAKDLQNWWTSLKRLMLCWTKSITLCNRLRKRNRTHGVTSCGHFRLRLIRISSIIPWIRLSGWRSLMIVGAWSTSPSLWLNIFDWLSTKARNKSC